MQGEGAKALERSWTVQEHGDARGRWRRSQASQQRSSLNPHRSAGPPRASTWGGADRPAGKTMRFDDWMDNWKEGSPSSASLRLRHSPLQDKVKQLLDHHMFDMGIGVVIAANCLSIGLEINSKDSGDQEGFWWVETICLVIYIIELILRFFAGGRRTFRDNWVKFDLALVIIGTVSTWIIEPIWSSNNLGLLMVLRTTRLFRLARAVRRLLIFRELWMLVRGLMNSLPTMTYTMLMLFIILYIAGCIAVQIISRHPYVDEPEHQEFTEHVEYYFPDLPNSMITLMQFVTADSMGGIYMPLVKEDPRLALFFLPMIIVITIVLANLITAVVVNSSIEAAMQDREVMHNLRDQEKKKLMRELRTMFKRLDLDGNGDLTLAELQEHLSKEESREDAMLFSALCPGTSPDKIFNALDAEENGSLKIEEFCDGIWSISTSAASLEVMQLKKELLTMIRKELSGHQDWILGELDVKLSSQSRPSAIRPSTVKESTATSLKESTAGAAPGTLKSPQVKAEEAAVARAKVAPGSGSDAAGNNLAPPSASADSPWTRELKRHLSMEVSSIMESMEQLQCRTLAMANAALARATTGLDGAVLPLSQTGETRLRGTADALPQPLRIDEVGQQQSHQRPTDVSAWADDLSSRLAREVESMVAGMQTMRARLPLIAVPPPEQPVLPPPSRATNGRYANGSTRVSSLPAPLLAREGMENLDVDEAAANGGEEEEEGMSPELLL